MPFDNYSFAKRLVQSTAIDQNGSHVHKGNGVSSSPASSSSSYPQPTASAAPAQNPVNLPPVSAELPIEPEEQDGDHHFARWVDRLDERVERLEGSIATAGVEWLEREANTCEAEAKHLRSYARQHSVNYPLYIERLSAIETRLRYLEQQISQKAERVEQAKRPRWRKVVEIVLRVVSIVADFVGLAPLGGVVQGLLSSAKEIKRLTSGS